MLNGRFQDELAFDDCMLFANDEQKLLKHKGGNLMISKPSHRVSLRSPVVPKLLRKNIIPTMEAIPPGTAGGP